MRSYFSDLTSSSEGGAISVDSTSVYVSETTFSKCSAVDGGAVRVIQATMEAFRCCAIECSGHWGSVCAIWGDTYHTEATWVESNLQKCSGTGQGSFAIAGDSNRLTLDRLNFTDIVQEPHGGAAVRTETAAVIFGLSYSTILRCQGSTSRELVRTQSSNSAISVTILPQMV
jgi:hypothetical protein